MPLNVIDILTIALHVNNFDTLKKLILINKKCKKGINNLKINMFKLNKFDVKYLDMFPAFTTLKITSKDYYNIDKINYIRNELKKRDRELIIKYELSTNNLSFVKLINSDIFNFKNVSTFIYNPFVVDYINFTTNHHENNIILSKDKILETFPNIKLFKILLSNVFKDDIEYDIYKLDDIKDVEFKICIYFMNVEQIRKYIKSANYTYDEIKSNIYYHKCYNIKIHDFSYDKVDLIKSVNEVNMNELLYKDKIKDIDLTNIEKCLMPKNKEYKLFKLVNIWFADFNKLSLSPFIFKYYDKDYEHKDIKLTLTENIKYIDIKNNNIDVDIIYDKNNAKYLKYVYIFCNNLKFNGKNELNINDFKFVNFNIKVTQEIRINDKNYTTYSLILN